MEAKKQIDIIREKCKERGLKIRSVFRKAQVPESTIQNWTIKEPEAFTNLDKINKAIDEMHSENLKHTASEVTA